MKFTGHFGTRARSENTPDGVIAVRDKEHARCHDLFFEFSGDPIPGVEAVPCKIVVHNPLRAAKAKDEMQRVAELAGREIETDDHDFDTWTLTELFAMNEWLRGALSDAGYDAFMDFDVFGEDEVEVCIPFKTGQVELVYEMIAESNANNEVIEQFKWFGKHEIDPDEELNGGDVMEAFCSRMAIPFIRRDDVTDWRVIEQLKPAIEKLHDISDNSGVRVSAADFVDWFVNWQRDVRAACKKWEWLR